MMIAINCNWADAYMMKASPRPPGVSELVFRSRIIMESFVIAQIHWWRKRCK
jgi:hypothetical protein